MNVNVLEIVEAYLKNHGYDGLFVCGECACLVDDLAPCGQLSTECTAGYKIDTPGGQHDWIVRKNKPKGGQR